MTARLGAMVAALALAVPALAAAEQLDTAQFSVKLPANAERTERAMESGTGPLVMYVAGDDDGAVMFSWVDYPASFADLPPQQLLGGARDGAMGNVGATLDEDQEITISAGAKKWPGRRVVGKSESKGIAVEARLYLVRSRLYQLIAIHKIGKDAPAGYAPMLASFKLKAAK